MYDRQPIQEGTTVTTLSKTLRRSVLEGTVFICGAMVMTFEIIGSRILSPYIGASTYVWTSLIGVILGSLSLGYWLGGRTADRNPSMKVLSAVIMAAGGLIAVTVLIKEVVLSFVTAAPVGIELRSLLASIVLFAPASVALGFVTPYSVKLRLDSLGHRQNGWKAVCVIHDREHFGHIRGRVHPDPVCRKLKDALPDRRRTNRTRNTSRSVYGHSS